MLKTSFKEFLFDWVLVLRWSNVLNVSCFHCLWAINSRLNRKAETTGHFHSCKRNAIQCFLPVAEYPLSNSDCIHLLSMHRHLNRQCSASYKVFLSCRGTTYRPCRPLRKSGWPMPCWHDWLQHNLTAVRYSGSISLFLRFNSIYWNCVDVDVT